MERSENSWQSQFMMRQHQFIRGCASRKRKKALPPKKQKGYLNEIAPFFY
jgi:hypothetical protein